MSDHDVIVVGSGLAGPATAILLARQGVRVALLEAHRDPQHYKRLCTHFIQSSALPVLQRLGVVDELNRAGAIRNSGHFWTRYGWVHEREPADRPAHGYNVRRQTLDPMLRELARSTPGVEVVLGAKVRDVVRDPSGRVRGVLVREGSAERELTASLVVGADGRSSTVAAGAGLEGKEWPNGRFGFFAHYRGVEVANGQCAQFWMRPPDAVYTFVNDDGVTLLAAMPGKARLADFEDDREAALLAMYADLPDGPDLTRAERVSDVIGTKDYPSLTRARITAPGVALVGDAAMVGDPLWGVGCGFALQTGSWLADAVGPALTSTGAAARDGAVDRAAATYARHHRRRLGLHQKLLIDCSSGRDFNPLERLIYAGAARDPKVADRMWAYGTRNASPMSLFSPALLARAALARRRPLPAVGVSAGVSA
jgi:2-polyprenyl-6-methoxyphenol hydroxylase-like FAD-dependent oxidoreductase